MENSDPIFPSNSSLNDTNATCLNRWCMSDEDYITELEDYIYPSHYEWVLIGFHLIVFVIGLTGNALVCVSLYRNPAMRTVTNVMIMNLSIADFLVILVCLPPTVVWDVTETWFMGELMCRMVLYVQTVSVTVSVSTLTCIAMDRFYAICHPLKFVSTMRRAKQAIVCIWVVAILSDIPDLVVMTTIQRRVERPDTVYLTECNPTWSDSSEQVHQFLRLAFLYVIPLAFMMFVYFRIFRVLWTSGEVVIGQQLSPSGGRGCDRTISTNTNSTIESQLKSRKKAAKMLIVVVVTFALCFLPVHLLNTLRLVITMEQNDYLIAASIISHWLCYFNSAVNPVIYNFMSRKFRREFYDAINCFSNRRKRSDTFHPRGHATITTHARHNTIILKPSGVSFVTRHSDKPSPTATPALRQYGTHRGSDAAPLPPGFKVSSG